MRTSRPPSPSRRMGHFAALRSAGRCAPVRWASDVTLAAEAAAACAAGLLPVPADGLAKRASRCACVGIAVKAT